MKYTYSIYHLLSINIFLISIMAYGFEMIEYWWKPVVLIELLINITIISGWSYSMLFSHIYRSIIYTIKFDQIRKSLKKILPERLYIIVPLYEPDSDVAERVLTALLREISVYGVPATLLLAGSKKFKSDKEFAKYKKIISENSKNIQIDVRISYQIGKGKRDSLRRMIRLVRRSLNKFDSLIRSKQIVVMMDGDTVVSEGIFSKTVPFLLNDSLNCGALITDNIEESDYSWIHKMYNELRFDQRNMYQSSEVTVLTGRFAMYRSEVFLNSEMEMSIGFEEINHPIYGKLFPKTGDDKSALAVVRKCGLNSMYIRDVYVTCIERLPQKGPVYTYMHLGILDNTIRYVGNMFRLGIKLLKDHRLSFYTRLTYLDQQLGFWRGLVGPSAAAWKTNEVGWPVLIMYGFFVILLRLFIVLLLRLMRYNHKPQFKLGDFICSFLTVLPSAFFLYISQLLLNTVQKIFNYFFLDYSVWGRAGISGAEIGMSSMIIRFSSGIAVILIIVMLTGMGSYVISL